MRKRKENMSLELFMPLDGKTPVKVKPLPTATASATVGWLVTIRRILAAMLGRNERSCVPPFFSEGKLEKY